MILYYSFAAIILLVQSVAMIEAWRHIIYVKRKYRPKPPVYHPRVALICPCKGLDTTFQRDIDSLFYLDYHDYEIFFSVESTGDPAYVKLKQIIEKHHSDQGNNYQPPQAHVVIADIAKTSSQKVHNLLAVCDNLPKDFEVLAFVDSDACLKPHFLNSLVHPLRRQDVGAATGYRLFVPTDRSLPSAVLSAVNAFFASTLGPHSWNSVWGGAMALKRKVYDEIQIKNIWQHACSDDYALSYAIKKAKLKIIFVPACLVASYEKTSWKNIFDFARRQFIITRIYMPALYLLALFAVGHFFLVFWTGLALSLYLFAIESHHAPFAAILPGVLFIGSIIKGLLRQNMFRKILHEDRRQLLIPALIDIFLQPFLTGFTLMVLLCSAFSRTIVWRNIRYILHNINYTEIIPADRENT